MFSTVVLKLWGDQIYLGRLFKMQTPEDIPYNSDSVGLGCGPEICHDSHAGVPWDPA